MRRINGTTRRGLTLLELMLALTITALVAGAIYGMLGAVSSGLMSNRDSRDIMVRANAAQTRIGAYIASSNAILAADAESIVLWLDDTRVSGTVHATEIRWLVFDDYTDELYVYFVTLPDAWSQAARDLEDAEYAPGTDWNTVLNNFLNKGLMSSLPLIDGVESVAVELDAPPASARHVGMDIAFQASNSAPMLRVSSSIRFHQAPN